MVKRKEVPTETIKRLPIYLRILRYLLKRGEEYIRSEDLAQSIRANPAQIRRDLSYFGDFGIRGVGYGIEELVKEIRSILGLNKKREIVLVGVGNIGSALLTYPGFQLRNLEISMAFDRDPKIVGKEVGSVKVRDVENLTEKLSERKMALGIIAVPSSSAQEVAQKLIKGGIKNILNFAPTMLDLPAEVHVAQVDIIAEAESLLYYLQEEGRKGDKENMEKK